MPNNEGQADVMAISDDLVKYLRQVNQLKHIAVEGGVVLAPGVVNALHAAAESIESLAVEAYKPK